MRRNLNKQCMCHVELAGPSPAFAGGRIRNAALRRCASGARHQRARNRQAGPCPARGGRCPKGGWGEPCERPGRTSRPRAPPSACRHLPPRSRGKDLERGAAALRLRRSPSKGRNRQAGPSPAFAGEGSGTRCCGVAPPALAIKGPESTGWSFPRLRGKVPEGRMGGALRMTCLDIAPKSGPHPPVGTFPRVRGERIRNAALRRCASGARHRRPGIDRLVLPPRSRAKEASAEPRGDLKSRGGRPIRGG